MTGRRATDRPRGGWSGGPDVVSAGSSPSSLAGRPSSTACWRRPGWSRWPRAVGRCSGWAGCAPAVLVRAGPRRVGCWCCPPRRPSRPWPYACCISSGWPPAAFAVEDAPLGLVLQTQQLLILSSLAELTRWPRYLERVQPLGANSACILPLTTARHRLGTLVFASEEQAAYDDADLDFLQRLAKQVAVAFENALAFDRIEELKEKLEKEKVYLEEEIRTDNNFEEIVGESVALRRVLKEVETVAPTESTVLIHGETGTGKELIARALHQLSPSRQRTFVKLNCAAIPSGLLESELFGHEKGAFTGAIAQKVGRFELAHQGTLFLDEVGDIPLELQPKLLRVLQEQEFERLGSTKTIRVRVRLVAATNRDLPRMVRDGQFRSDLYYRLNVFPILVPPLRERPEDIPRLVRTEAPMALASRPLASGYRPSPVATATDFHPREESPGLLAPEEP